MAAKPGSIKRKTSTTTTAPVKGKPATIATVLPLPPGTEPSSVQIKK